jgi:hypothetical protein
MTATWRIFRTRLMGLRRKQKTMKRVCPSLFSQLDHLLGMRIEDGEVRVFDFTSSWRSLLSSLYTGTIQFAPLKSQAIDERAKYVREKTEAGMPPPCSPKVIYSIAKAVSSHAHMPCVSEVIQRSTSSLRLTLFALTFLPTYSRNSLPRIYSLNSLPVSRLGRRLHYFRPYYLKTSVT